MTSMASDEKTGVNLIENPFHMKSLLGIPGGPVVRLGSFTARAWVCSLIRELKIPQIMQSRGGGSHSSLGVFKVSLFVTVIITLIMTYGLVDHLNLFF